MLHGPDCNPITPETTPYSQNSQPISIAGHPSRKALDLSKLSKQWDTITQQGPHQPHNDPT